MVSLLTGLTSAGFVRRPDGTVLRRALPALDLTYAEAVLHSDVREVDPASLAQLPAGLAGGQFDWVDLDGDGVAGVLGTDRAGGWTYAPNLSPLAASGLGNGDTLRFGAARPIAERPTADAGSRWLDVAGDGQSDLVNLHGPSAGFHERTADGGWERFVPFGSVPQLEWESPPWRWST